MRNRRAAMVALAAYVGALTLAPLPAARAAAQDRITVPPGQTVTRTYGAILGVNPIQKQHNDDLNQPSDPDPATCANLPSCDVIPLTVAQPAGLSVFDTFSLRVELRWTGASDLDLYLWYDPQGTVPAKKSTSSANPETVVFPAPTSRLYQLVVSNAAGANSGYTLVVTSHYVRGERPNDLNAAPTTFPPPTVAPPTGGSASTVAPLQAAATPVVPAGEPLDPDLGNLTAAGRAPDIFNKSPSGSRGHRPVSGGAIALWAGLLPLLAASAVGTVLYRRRPRALSFRGSGGHSPH